MIRRKEIVMADLPKPPPTREITPEAIYLRRREFLKEAALTLGTATLVGGGLLALTGGLKTPREKGGGAGPATFDLPRGVTASASAASGGSGTGTGTGTGAFDTDEPRTPYRAVTTYNNFYE